MFHIFTLKSGWFIVAYWIKEVRKKHVISVEYLLNYSSHATKKTDIKKIIFETPPASLSIPTSKNIIPFQFHI